VNTPRILALGEPTIEYDQTGASDERPTLQGFGAVEPIPHADRVIAALAASLNVGKARYRHRRLA